MKIVFLKTLKDRKQRCAAGHFTVITKGVEFSSVTVLLKSVEIGEISKPCAQSLVTLKISVFLEAQGIRYKKLRLNDENIRPEIKREASLHTSPHKPC